MVLLLSVLILPVAEAQQYPTKPITLINPIGAGSATDVLMRAVLAVAPKYLEQPFVLELKPGGGGAIGTDLVSKAAPDGYTLLCGGPGWNSTLPAIEGRSKGPESFDAVCQINQSSSFTLVRADSQFKTLKDVIQWAKANPGKLIFGHTGVWGAADLFWKELKYQHGITTRDVSHDGGGPMLTALLGGHIDIGITAPPVALPHIQAGKLRALSYNYGNKRFPALPQVPTAREEGVNAQDYYWRTVLAPKGTPRPIIDKLAGVFKKITEDKAFIEALSKFGEEPGYLGPEEFTKVWLEGYEARKELAKIFKK
jgi:tripartite-type tricarboxylate transporter receptor subunit TctC